MEFLILVMSVVCYLLGLKLASREAEKKLKSPVDSRDESV